jgi:hypothetical protein
LRKKAKLLVVDASGNACGTDPGTMVGYTVSEVDHTQRGIVRHGDYPRGKPHSRKEIEMDIIIAIVILVVSIAAESYIISRARRRAEYEDAVMARLAHYAGRQR